MNKSLIIYIGNSGCADKVMDHMRNFGVKGGTIIHGKSSLTDKDEKFFKITIHPEKEVLLIACLEEQKDKLMKEIYNNFGSSKEANGVVFSVEIDKLIGVEL